MSTPRRPSSIDGIKRHAKAIARETALQHARALDEAAKLAGFQNFAHARHALAAKSSAAEPPPPRGNARSAFHQRAREAWNAGVDTVNPDRRASVSWEGQAAIMAALRPFMGPSANHAHLPSGGGRDFLSADPSNEKGCIDFAVGDHSSYIARPKRLTLERIAQVPGESFLLLELDILRPSGVYPARVDDDHDDPVTARLRQFEEVLELAPGDYVDRGVWDDGHLGYDENDDEIPLPDSARLIIRWLRGKILFVCKGSLWNGTPSTYDGRHNRMTVQEVREVIERSIAATG